MILFDLSGNSFTKLRNAGHRGILVITLLHVKIYQTNYFFGDIEIRKALRQINGSVLVGKLRHYCKYRIFGVGLFTLKSTWKNHHAYFWQK